ncbi:hypothetical protein [Pseudokineococcus sp. 1T1Z-3]|uniref:hypothetical protein n=1 Tax=Pseudokineococcus sp. 1T1Z-3 TaxID=3132745 RepID=UPI0030A778C8
MTTSEGRHRGADLSVVVVSPHGFTHVRRCVRHLREQDDAARVELVLVVPGRASLDDAAPGELDGFASVVVLPVGPVPDVDRAAGRGLLAASAPVVAVVEDHAYVGPGWVTALLAAYAGGDWCSVGSVMTNANPATGLSWANLLLGYGWWVDPGAAGELPDVPSHNGSYRRSALAPFGDALPERMGRDGDLHDALRAAGGRMLLARGATVAHANPSTLAPTVDLRLNAGRLYAAGRADGEGWSAPRRLAFAAAWPLVAAVRLRRLHAEHLAAGRHLAGAPRRVLLGLATALVVDALGQALGALRGAGPAVEVLRTFEQDRLQHLRRPERALLVEETPR